MTMNNIEKSYANIRPLEQWSPAYMLPNACMPNLKKPISRQNAHFTLFFIASSELLLMSHISHLESLKLLGQASSHGVANATPRQQDASFLPPLGIFFTMFYCCYVFVVKEKSEILVKLNLGLCDILESSIFSCTHIIHSIVMIYGVKYALTQCTT